MKQKLEQVKIKFLKMNDKKIEDESYLVETRFWALSLLWFIIWLYRGSGWQRKPFISGY